MESRWHTKSNDRFFSFERLPVEDSGAGEGARLGLLVGIFVVCAAVGDEYVTLNIGRKLALAMAAGRLFEWTLVGIVVGLVYKPKEAS